MYGQGRSHDLLVSPLHWFSMPVPLDGNLMQHALDEGSRTAIGGAGVYCIEGRQDARPEGGILYIGLANGRREDGELESGTPGQPVHERASQSLAKVRWSAGGVRGFFADVWDLKLRWASVDVADVAEVEQNLIHAHAPSFNRQHVRSELNLQKGRVILNAGDKGRLLPVVCSLYFDGPFWRNIE
ncbi:uncharacterized protein SOCE26_036750 [Sorangium cellulosum]|uniref:GIY-YIG nuclease family protein n=1 Tax=Sorangium cellulosum TaxID=56 RepID=A0A2L0ESH1_SORCE|nr:uncharacterized protein SOCE26_036750 [Sorangium cellulosum]